MSSLHQDRLLVEGSGPDTGTASPLPSGRGTRRRRIVGTAEEQATGPVPTRRPGTTQQSGATTTTTARKASKPRGKHAAPRAAATGSLAARAKAVTAKAATAKAATAKAATAKAATAARAAAVATVANRTASVRVARANSVASRVAAPATKTVATKTVKPAASEATTAKATTEKPTATAKPATTKPATTKPATTKPATTKPATTKPTTAKPAAAGKTTAAKPAAEKAPTKAENPAPAKAAAKASTTKASTTKASTTKAAPAKAAPAAPVTKAPRPTPYKRAEAAVPVFVPVIDVAHLHREEAPEAVVVPKDVPAAFLPAGAGACAARLPRFLRRRPALCLAAALVGSLGVTTITTAGPEARATATVSHSVSVAEQLGIETADRNVAIVADIATERLGELAASRNARDAEQAAAAQAQAEADRAAAEAAAAAAAEAARPKVVFPVQGARLTSTFGPRWGTLHAGIDLAAPMLTPELAVMDGVVLEAGPASGYGNVVYIQHENGDVTVYGHMEKILVQAGQVVRAGDTIALLGNRGQSTGPHLHFEVHVGGMNGTKVDPLPWLRERGLDI
jgi:murein DD-endopeptidase MepM/ murein hydrolase activator NlpD